MIGEFTGEVCLYLSVMDGMRLSTGDVREPLHVFDMSMTSPWPVCKPSCVHTPQGRPVSSITCGILSPFLWSLSLYIWFLENVTNMCTSCHVSRAVLGLSRTFQDYSWLGNKSDDLINKPYLALKSVGPFYDCLHHPWKMFGLCNSCSRTQGVSPMPRGQILNFNFTSGMIVKFHEQVPWQPPDNLWGYWTTPCSHKLPYIHEQSRPFFTL